ncbi:MAG: thioredoxin [Rhodothermales bacterium]
METRTGVMQNFKEDVLDRSSQIPVLVDFWAPWCGPCRFLGPVLDRLAAEQSDRWELVKVNTDENPEISAQFGIRGIPAVKLFVNGEVVDEFTGALPEPAVRQWLDKAIPSENRKLVRDAEDAIEEGDTTRAEELLERVLTDEPTNPTACGLLARLVVWNDPKRASELARCAGTGEPELVRLAGSVSELAAVLSDSTDTNLPDGPGRESFAKALDSIRSQDFDAALSSLIHVITIDRYYNDDKARKLCIALFDMLGEQHEITRKHRRIFDMSLY